MVKRTSTEAFHNKDTVEVRKVNLYHSISAWLMENALTNPGEWVEITLPFWSKKNYPWRFFVAHKFNFFFISDLGSALGTLGCAEVTEMCKIEPAELRMHEPGALLCCSSDDVIDVVDTFFRFLNKLIAIKSIPKEQSNSDTNKKDAATNKQDNEDRFQEKILSCSRVISERERLHVYPETMSPFKFPWFDRDNKVLNIKVQFDNDEIRLWSSDITDDWDYKEEYREEIKNTCDRLGLKLNNRGNRLKTEINYTDDRDAFFDKVMNYLCALYDTVHIYQLHDNNSCHDVNI